MPLEIWEDTLQSTINDGVHHVRAQVRFRTSASESKRRLCLRLVEAARAAVDNQTCLTVTSQRVLAERASIRKGRKTSEA